MASSADLPDDASGSKEAMEVSCSTLAAPREGERGEEGSARIWLAGGDRGVAGSGASAERAQPRA